MSCCRCWPPRGHTAAAGDTLVGVLTVALARGLTLRQAVAAAQLAVTRHGAQPSIPTRAELNRFRLAYAAEREALGLR